MMFQGISSRSFTVRMPMMKNSSVEISIRAARSMGCRSGTTDLRDITTTTPKTISSTIFSWRVIGPRCAASLATLSFSPAISFFSGFRKVIR